MTRPASPQVLVVDIGNTSITFGRYHAGRVTGMQRLPTREATVAAVDRLLCGLAGDRTWSGASCCSVVPRQQARWQRTIRRRLGFDPLWVDHHTDLGVAIDYPRPETIGADRLANAAGAVARFGAPVVVADFGTALTFDVVSTRGYIGGVIAPGLPLMLDYLHERTAKLPHLEIRATRRAIGRSTEEAMRIGAERGYRGMIAALFQEIILEMGEPEPTLVGTGGHARKVLSKLGRPVAIEPNLTLFGLGVIHDRVSSDR